jgi:hypothetical protein
MGPGLAELAHPARFLRGRFGKFSKKDSFLGLINLN